MKKIIAIVMSLVLAVAVLGGCSSSRTTSSKTAQTSTPTATATPTSTETPKTDKFADIVEEVNGYRRFKMTRTEFIERYNKLARDKQLKEIDVKSNETTPVDTSSIVGRDKNNGAAKVHTYKFSSSQNFSQEIGFLVDKDDNILQVTYGEKASSLKNNIERFYIDVPRIMYLALFKTVTTSDVDTEIEIIKQEGHALHTTWGTRVTKIENTDEDAWAVQLSKCTIQ